MARSEEGASPQRAVTSERPSQLLQAWNPVSKHLVQRLAVIPLQKKTTADYADIEA